jgi:hypothetical protein
VCAHARACLRACVRACERERERCRGKCPFMLELHTDRQKLDHVIALISTICNTIQSDFTLQF